MLSRSKSTRNRIVKLKSYSKPRSSQQNRAHQKLNTTDKEPLINEQEGLQKDTEEYLQHLIKKNLFPSSECVKFQDMLPSLTSSAVVDLQLYALFSLLIRSFVQRWYVRVTDDQEFIPELISLVSHITRNIDTRIRENIQLELLILDDLPFLLDEHLKTYREVHLKLGTTFLPFDTIDKGFDSLMQNRGLDEVTENGDYYLQILTTNFIQLLLPEDERNSKLVAMFVNGLVSDLALSNSIRKIVKPYQIFEIITLICQTILNDKKQTHVDGDSNPNFTSKNKYKATCTTEIFQIIVSKFSKFVAYTTSSYETEPLHPNKKIASLHIFSFLENLFQIAVHRPILFAAFKIFQFVGLNSKLNNILYNVLSNTLIQNLKKETLYASIVNVFRRNLFPTDEDMGPPRVEPTNEEFEAIRKVSKNSLKRVCLKYKIPSDLLLASDEDELEDILDDFLTGFENERINKHLILNIIELLVSKLFPELVI